MRIIILLLTFSISLFTQAQTCLCTSDQYISFGDDEPFDVFEFTNGEKLKVCPPFRYNFDNDHEIYFKDFALESCTNKTKIGVWGNLFCKAIFNNDMLLIIETVNLPVGRKRKFEVVNKSITKVYFENGKAISKFKELPVRKYDQTEIEAVLKEYDIALKNKKTKTKRLYSSLLVAGLSGNQKALEYFINFQSDFENIIGDNEIEDYNNLKSAFIETEE